MNKLEEAKKPKSYTFRWEIIGFECCRSPAMNKIRSPTFTVSFEVTKWHMELDLSNLKNSEITVRLVRNDDIGPRAVTFDVTLSGIFSNTFDENGFAAKDNKILRACKFESMRQKTFEKNGYWDTVIPISPSKLSNLLSENLILELKIESLQGTNSKVLKRYWCNDISLRTVEENLKKLYSDGNFHDLDLKVNGETFKLHKCILNARWPKLVSILNLSETATEVETEVFSGVKPAILENLFQFAYYGDLDFIYEMEDSEKVFDLVKKHNFYRLYNTISQISPSCEITQTFQSYKTSFEMELKNVTNVVPSREAIGNFIVYPIPRELQIGSINFKLYVNKGPLGLNWLTFAVVLDKLPEKNPVTILCKLYVTDKGCVWTFLAEECLIFDKQNKQFEEISFSIPISEEEIKRYKMVSKPVITWDNLTDEKKNFMQKRMVFNSETGECSEMRDIHFQFKLNVIDGNHILSETRGINLFDFKWDYKIFDDLEFIYNNGIFADIEVTSSDGIKCIKAHKAILAARSVVLKAILEEQLELTSLRLDIECDYLQSFIHYLYTGQIQEVPTDKIDHLLSVADKYDMKCLKEVLENENLKRKMTLEEGGSCSKKMAT